MSADNMLEDLQQEWVRITPEVPDLSGRVKRETRRMRWTLALEVMVTVVVGGGTILAALRSDRADMAVLAAATWLFLAAAWGFGIWSRRDAWGPAVMTTSAYLEVTIRRSRSAIRNATFGMVLFWVEMMFCVGWIYARQGSFAFLAWPEMIAVGVASVVFMSVSVGYRKRKQTELASLLSIEQAMRSAGE